MQPSLLEELGQDCIHDTKAAVSWDARCQCVISEAPDDRRAQGWEIIVTSKTQRERAEG